MSVQRERVLSLRRSVRDAVRDGEPEPRVVRLRAILAREEAILAASREPGESRTVADAEADRDEDGD